jgi:hypothetical protein
MKRRVCLVLLVVFLAPALPDLMRTWHLRHRHPDPRFLTTVGDFYGVDKPRVYRFKDSKYPVEITGKSWRPDPSAQVDEIRVRLYEVNK